MTSATEELRRLLDERGVEWWPMHDIESGYREDRDTEFLIYGCKHVAHEWGCRLQVDMLTPEQAIAATLGRGTCRNASKVMDEHGQARFACSECGAWIDSRILWNPEYRNGESPWVNDCKLNYCPNCGAKVVEE